MTFVDAEMDRPLGSSHPKHPDIVYPVNYGYVPGLLGGDDEEQDVYVLGVDRPLERFHGKLIARILRADDVEEKWVACPESMDFSAEEVADAVRFQEKYHDSRVVPFDYQPRVNPKTLLARRLALDLACSPEDIMSPDNVFTTGAPSDGARAWPPVADSPALVCAVNGKLAVRAPDGDVLDVLRTELAGVNARGLSRFALLRSLDNALRTKNIRIADVKPYLIPDICAAEPEKLPEGFSAEWFAGTEIEKFRGDARFSDALGFLPGAPDVIAVAAADDEGIAAMAGASRDANLMWQIGVNTLPRAEGLGLASRLAAALRERLAGYGVLAYYGANASHSASRTVAVRAGFLPAFCELTTEKI